jgi:tRNA dimethylallyltransferase
VRSLSLDAALARLRKLNPGGLGGLDVANPRRVSRALERCLASGLTLEQLAADFARIAPPFSGYTVKLTHLDCAPEELERRIHARVVAMIRDGLVDEVTQLRALGLAKNPSAAKAIGYREVLALLEGQLDQGNLADEIIRNTRALVKKQRTWFRTQLPEHRTLNVATLDNPNDLFV